MKYDSREDGVYGPMEAVRFHYVNGHTIFFRSSITMKGDTAHVYDIIDIADGRLERIKCIETCRKYTEKDRNSL